MAPKFLSTSQTELEVMEGSSVRLCCRISGKPAPVVQWFSKGVTLGQDARHSIVVDETGYHSLMIPQAVLSDTGVFECLAKNKAGVASFQCKLRVLPIAQKKKPVFVEKIRPAQVKEDESITIRVKAVGDPAPKLNWLKVWRSLINLFFIILVITNPTPVDRTVSICDSTKISK